MLPPPMAGAIVPIPSEEDFLNTNLTEEEIDTALLASNAFEDEENEEPGKKIRVRFKKLHSQA